MLSRRRCFASLLVLAAALLSLRSLSAAAPDQVPNMTGRAIEFLRTTQAADGSWTSPEQPGISALVVASLLKSGVGVGDPTVARGLKHLETFVQSDGGIYFPKTAHKNYETSIALLAFDAANKDGRYDVVIRKAADFLKGIQWGGGGNLDRADIKFGGAGYGRSGDRPDLSNTAFLVDALVAAGASRDDPAIQNALVFVSRCQNLESQHNTTEFAAKVNDGGFYYTPAAGGTSQAGPTPNGGLRSYASMTYAGLKSMIHAGLTPDDPRVAAATKWIKQFYTLDENPGMGQVGKYYYYHTFAKALDVAGVDIFEDAAGGKHDWRQELAEHLAAQQQSNGSWVNSADRWYEGNPDLATAYSLLALEHCRKNAKN